MLITFTWYGHSAMGLRFGEHNILIDPFFTGNPTASTTADKVAADYILVSHGHGDHVGDAVAIAKRTGATVISNFEICNWLEAQGVTVHSQHIGGGYHHPFGYLKLTQALHGSALPDGANGGSACGFLLTPKGASRKLYFACDTGLFGDMRLLGEEGLALAVLPIGDNYTMGPDDALRAVKLLEPTHVVPVHYNTLELIRQDAHAWARRVETETRAKATVLSPGASVQITL